MSKLSQHKQFSWFALIIDFTFFAYFSCALQLFISLTGHSNANGLRDAFIYSWIWLIPIIIFPNYTRILTAVIGLILCSSAVVLVGYFAIYRQEFSQSVFFVMAESNTIESHEFMQQYVNRSIILLLLAFVSFGILLWFFTRPIYLKKSTKWIVSLAILIYALAPFFYTITNKHYSVKRATSHLLGRLETSVPWQLVNSYIAYRHQLSTMENMLSRYDTLQPLQNLHDSNDTNTPRTLVLVIGESTTRLRMGIYGYERNTTPLIERFQQQNPHFYVFNDVVTSRPYTIEILQQALTFADEKNPDLYLELPSIIHLMKQAGYKTYWITNQQTMTKRNTMLTMFSKQTDKQYYMNNDRNQSARQYDENVFAPFQQTLSDPAEKKFIIVHLLGTHMRYEFRYPKTPQYQVFDAQNDLPFELDKQKLAVYNSYDNAVLYNDYVTSSLFSIFKKRGDNGFMLYFSDHGEDVYQTPPHNILGRNEKDPTKTMYTIPFMLWTSDSWQKTHPIPYQQYVDRKYSSQYLIHTWSDLAGLHYDLYEPKKSLVNKDFVEQPRWIGDPYDHKNLHKFDDLLK